MAAHLVRAGHRVTGFNRSSTRIDPLIAVGGQGGATLADAVHDKDAVVLMLPSDTEVRDVLTGSGGVVEHASPGTLLIDCSTISPPGAREHAALAREHGLRHLDAPVSGGEAGAKEAKLSIMVGGETADFEEARPILEAVGTTIVHVGPAGSGQIVKAANQLIVAGILELLAEAILLMEAYDVFVPEALEIFKGGLAASAVLDQKGSTMPARQQRPGARMSLHHKDLGILSQAAREVGVVLPLGSTVSQLMTASIAQGDADLDHSAIINVIERLARGTPAADVPRVSSG